jgi:hypothetical protein
MLEEEGPVCCVLVHLHHMRDRKGYTRKLKQVVTRHVNSTPDMQYSLATM